MDKQRSLTRHSILLMQGPAGSLGSRCSHGHLPHAQFCRLLLRSKEPLAGNGGLPPEEAPKAEPIGYAEQAPEAEQGE